MALIDVVNDHDEVIDSVPYEHMAKNGLRHRIARIFLFDKQGRLFLQRRSMNMSVAPGLWDQSAAGHVDPGEDYAQAAYRELKEELGIEVDLRFLIKYYAEEEHPKYQPMRRFQAVFVGEYNNEPMALDPKEVMDGKWMDVDALEDWMTEHPSDFTPAFVDAYQRYKKTM